MNCKFAVLVVVFAFLAVLNAATAASVETPVITDNFIEARALNYGRRTTIAAKILCVTDTIDRVVNEYQCQSVWRNVEDKLQTSIGNMFLCLKYQGFQVQGLVSRVTFYHLLFSCD